MDNTERVVVAAVILGAGVCAQYGIWFGAVALGLVAICATIDFCSKSR